MPIPELQKFRRKYPQYNDLDDFEIADRLARKYPSAYGNLVQKTQSDVGTITETSFANDLISRAKRFGAGETKALVGDIPFVRQVLPEQIKKFEPYYGYEKATQFATRLGRDIFLMKGIGRLGLTRTALRGAGIGIATAGTEEPEKILGKGVIGAIALPTIKKVADVVSPIISGITRKGLKTTQQMWQDLIRAGFMVEKSTVERVQQKGMEQIFAKTTEHRSKDAFLKLGNQIFNSAMKLRKNAGNVLGRWRQQILKDPRIRVSVVNSRNTFQGELKKPYIKLLAETGEQIAPIDLGRDTAKNRLLEIDNLLRAGDNLPPDMVYRIVDRLDDLITATKRGTLSIGRNEGRIVVQLRNQLKNQIIKAAPRSIAKHIANAEKKFSEIAEVTDDIFEKLPLRKEGVALSERIGGTEKNLMRGLQAATPAEERAVYTKLDKLLPQQEKFMEFYKDVFAAQDLQREGIGWLLRRLFLAPRMAAFGLQTIQPIMRRTGQIAKITGVAAKRLAPPITFREFLKSRREE